MKNSKEYYWQLKPKKIILSVTLCSFIQFICNFAFFRVPKNPLFELILRF